MEKIKIYLSGKISVGIDLSQVESFSEYNNDETNIVMRSGDQFTIKTPFRRFETDIEVFEMSKGTNRIEALLKEFEPGLRYLAEEYSLAAKRSKEQRHVADMLNKPRVNHDDLIPQPSIQTGDEVAILKHLAPTGKKVEYIEKSFVLDIQPDNSFVGGFAVYTDQLAYPVAICFVSLNDRTLEQ